ncbi:class I SAM-dependent methyltransferase [Ectothiorhodospiraceae bacterium WFHF3C12]|nr:class I SAM-dependent methyltransferase [Ectothiorhodospiraceae bacterium WFHF3C12]
MSNKTLQLPDYLHEYLVAHGPAETPELRRLREETARLPMAGMQIAPEQGQFLAFLVRLIGARRVVEVGVFTGYSALWQALALPEAGRLVGCDINAEWTRIAEEYWAAAGVDDRIELRLGPAKDTLDTLLDESGEGSFDFAFIDADKENYEAYYERCLRLLRPGGVCAIDNVLWSGRVAKPRCRDADTLALRAFNERLSRDERVHMAMVPIADGVSLAIKR